MMNLDIDSKLWDKIFYRLRGEFDETHHPNDIGYTKDLVCFFSDLGINILRDSDGRWESVKIELDDEELGFLFSIPPLSFDVEGED